MNFEETRE